MKAVGVISGQASSIHLAELPKPSVDEVPNGRGVLVQVLCVGVDGTDKEINAALVHSISCSKRPAIHRWRSRPWNGSARTVCWCWRA